MTSTSGIPTQRSSDAPVTAADRDQVAQAVALWLQSRPEFGTEATAALAKRLMSH